MAISIFDLFTIGIGPSSSHSVGPMRAAACFLDELGSPGCLERVFRVEVRLFGALACTAIGHAADHAIVMGLEGDTPETIVPNEMRRRVAAIKDSGSLDLAGRHSIAFHLSRDLILQPEINLPRHPNGMRFTALDTDGDVLAECEYSSIGGGFVINNRDSVPVDTLPDTIEFPFSSANELIGTAERESMPISDIVRANERSWLTDEQVTEKALRIWAVMQQCVQRGCHVRGILPGGLEIRRRAAELYRDLTQRPERALRDPLTVLDWVDVFALAVSEENAAGGRVVTAPTNGAAGIIPSVLHYYDRFCHGVSDEGIVRFLLTAGAIGLLYKQNASISGAEVGCQGEVGVACSMAAGALTEVLGGSVQQVEQAAEIGMEHNLGLTCDPMRGLVQVPCIERNAMGAVKAINAARMALRSNGQHKVSLDSVIQVMLRTGADMSANYKETSRGGLAVNYPEC